MWGTTEIEVLDFVGDQRDPHNRRVDSLNAFCRPACRRRGVSQAQKVSHIRNAVERARRKMHVPFALVRARTRWETIPLGLAVVGECSNDELGVAARPSGACNAIRALIL